MSRCETSCRSSRRRTWQGEFKYARWGRGRRRTGKENRAMALNSRSVSWPSMFCGSRPDAASMENPTVDSAFGRPNQWIEMRVEERRNGSAIQNDDPWESSQF